MSTSAISVSAQGYGNEAAFDYRAEMTGHIIIKPSTGIELLDMFANISTKVGAISVVKIFSHTYERGIIMSNWSGFYDKPGPEDTKRAKYIADLSEKILQGKIIFAPNPQIIIFGCNTAGKFSQELSAAIGGTVIASAGGTYPEIWGNKETGVFISTGQWLVYKNGNFAYSAGKRFRAW